LEKFAAYCRKNNFYSKCIINEACIYGCPGSVEHICSIGIREYIASQNSIQIYCDSPSVPLSSMFQTNFIAPQYLNLFEGKFDIAKIAGRSHPTDWIFNAFVAYLNGDREAPIESVMFGRLKPKLRELKLNLYAKDWPKKTLTCECKECDTCGICRKATEHVLKRSGLSEKDLRCPIS